MLCWQIIPGAKRDACIGSVVAKQRVCLDTVEAMQATEAGSSGQLHRLGERIRGILTSPGDATGYKCVAHDPPREARLRSGWWSKADIVVTISDDATVHSGYRVATTASGAIPLRELILEEEFDLLVAPVFDTLRPSLGGPATSKPGRSPHRSFSPNRDCCIRKLATSVPAAHPKPSPIRPPRPYRVAPRGPSHCPHRGELAGERERVALRPEQITRENSNLALQRTWPYGP